MSEGKKRNLPSLKSQNPYVENFRHTKLLFHSEATIRILRKFHSDARRYEPVFEALPVTIIVSHDKSIRMRFNRGKVAVEKYLARKKLLFVDWSCSSNSTATA